MRPRNPVLVMDVLAHFRVAKKELPVCDYNL